MLIRSLMIAMLFGVSFALLVMPGTAKPSIGYTTAGEYLREPDGMRLAHVTGWLEGLHYSTEVASALAPEVASAVSGGIVCVKDMSVGQITGIFDKRVGNAPELWDSSAVTVFALVISSLC